MPIYISDIDTTSDFILEFSESEQIAVIKPNVNLISEDAVAFFGEYGNETIYNYGNIFSNFDAILIYNDLGGGGDQIANYGMIGGGASRSGIVDFNDGSNVTNTGLINAGLYGVEIGGTSSILINTGTIIAPTAVFASGQNGLVTNRGDIEGTVNASGANTTIRNSGTIGGSVAFSAGTNVYDGRGGSVDGAVNGGVGDDTIRLGAGGEIANGGGGNDVIYGGAGADALAGGAGVNYLYGLGGADKLDGTGGISYADYATSPDYVVVNLLSGVATHGDAQGDTLVNIHRVVGSNFDDTITADNLGDVFQGGGGADTLTGGAGADVLFGGAGADILTGNGGADRFAFTSSAEGGDTITDFSVAQHDLIQVAAAGFGGGLTAGALAASHFANNAASAATGQFIWTAGANTLSWDADGTGAGAAVKIAVLTGVTTLTASSILVV